MSDNNMPGEVERLARDWINGKYLFIERGRQPADIAFDDCEMVAAFIAGRNSALTQQEKTDVE